MLPKVATHLFHHSSRAVAAVTQNPSSYTFRNVLQLQSSSSPSSATAGTRNGPSGSSNSGWNGTGSGGAKSHSGQRFYTGYTGVGRVVTQADASAAHSSSQALSDDSDDVSPQVIGLSHRARRNSISVDASARIEDAQSATVLRRTRLSVKTRHVVTDRPFSGNKPESALLPKIRGSVLVLQSSPSASAHIVARLESTVAINAVAPDADALSTTPPPPSLLSLPPIPPLDAAALASESKEESKELPEKDSSTPPPSPSVVPDPKEVERLSALSLVKSSGNPDAVLSLVKQWLASEDKLSHVMVNSALIALAQTRLSGQSIGHIVEVYDAFMARGARPNSGAYLSLIRTTRDRDCEIFRGIEQLQTEMRLLKACGVTEGPIIEEAEEALARLKAEAVSTSALDFFRKVLGFARDRVPAEVYSGVLHSCSLRGDVDAALEVCHEFEKLNQHFLPRFYTYLIQVYTAVGDLVGARTVFDRFLKDSKEGRIMWVAPDHKSLDALPEVTEADSVVIAQAAQISAYNAIMHAYFKCGDYAGAISLLEEMLDSPAGVDFKPDIVPRPAESTLSTVIKGFYEAGDLKTALAWFEKLLNQADPPVMPHQPTSAPTRPNWRTWNLMFDALTMEHRIDDLNRLFLAFADVARPDGLRYTLQRRSLVLLANFHYLDSNPTLDVDAKVAILDFLFDAVCFRSFTRSGDMSLITPESAYLNLLNRYLDVGHVDRALSVAEIYFKQQVDFACSSTGGQAVSQDEVPLSDLAGDLLDRFMAIPSPSLRQLLRVAAICNVLAVPVTPVLASRLVQTHQDLEKQGLTNDLSPHELDVIRKAAQSITESIQPETVQLEQPDLPAQVGDAAESHLAAGGLAARSEQASPAVSRSATYIPSAVPEHRKPFDQVTTAASSYDQLNADLKRGIMPRLENVGRLITWLGRLGELDKVRDLYGTAQTVLLGLEHVKERQSELWVYIEDCMVIALAHAGDVEAAHVHRGRIIEQGGTPSADAYGALIHYVKDTTDDTSNAMAIYQESQLRGVRNNMYLYNTIISKLAKARKADYAIQLFHEMKAKRITRTSVTFGAVIAACCRVGDAESAERLFDEMIRQPNFKPRVPPFNTMMQLYTQTKPNRERVLFYYDALLNARVHPTAHTYKLLLDAYGSIEPVDLHSMEQTFATLQADRRVSVQGTHWASLINSYGCVQKDLDQAISVFNSIATHPSTRPGTLPDAVVFEALFNVLVTLRRTDLLDHYTELLPRFGVHMTAYIANLLIKGFASSGDMEHARGIFESLVDPPQGVAAPHNRGPREGEHSGLEDLTNTPVYREPSTWETMVRAELGNGNRDRAMALLTRVQSRQFPAPVYQRISGIFLDDAVSPWASDTSAFTSSPASASL